MKSKDGEFEVKLPGQISENFPENSVFSSFAEASTFFKKVLWVIPSTKSERNWTA